jgi:glutaredoxin
MKQEIVMYTRGGFCPDVSRTRRNLQRWRLPHREINIRENPEAHQRCLDWNGCLAVPVIVVARQGENVPVAPPSPLSPGQSLRDLDREYMITEPSSSGLQAFLTRHGFLAPTDKSPR